MSALIRTSPRRPWHTAFLAGMASYLDAAVLTSTGIALVLYQSELGLTPADIGLLSGLLTISFAIGALFGGRLADRFGRRRVFTLALVGYVVGVALLAGAVSPWMLYVGIVIAGLSVGSDLPASLALTAEEAPEGKKGRMVSLSSLLWTLGAIVPGIAAIGLGALGPLGGRILYGHLVVVALVVLVLRRGVRESAEWQVQTRAIATGHEDVNFRQLPRLFKRPIVLTLVATALVYLMSTFATNTFGQFSTFIWVNLVGLSVPVASSFGLLAIPVSIICALILMKVADKRSRRVWVAIGAIALLFSFLLPALFDASVATILPATVFTTVGAVFAGEGIYKIWAQELFPTLLRSTAQGITIAFVRGSVGVAAIFTPLALSVSPQLVFALLTIAAAIGAVIAVVWVPRLPKASTFEPEPDELPEAVDPSLESR